MATKDSQICEGDSLLLNATVFNATEYLWDNGSTLSSIMVSQAGIYNVQLSNDCEVAFFDFEVETQSCDCTLEVPNVFTPNNDGINDIFEIRGADNIAKYKLTIFNRYGRKIYETNDINSHWSGDNVSSGVYFWAINTSCIQGQSITEKAYNGSISVLK